MDSGAVSETARSPGGTGRWRRPCPSGPVPQWRSRNDRKPPRSGRQRVIGHTRVMDDIEARVVAALDATGLPYQLIECDPAFADTAAFCERYGYAPERSANTIV